jgi:hypothetical protein
VPSPSCDFVLCVAFARFLFWGIPFVISLLNNAFVRFAIKNLREKYYPRVRRLG